MVIYRIKRFLPIIQLIISSNKKDQRQLLKILSKNDQFRTFVREVATNVYYKSIPVNKAQRQRLIAFRRIIINLSKGGRKKINNIKDCQQSGGFLQILLPILATLAGEVISKNV